MSALFQVNIRFPRMNQIRVCLAGKMPAPLSSEITEAYLAWDSGMLTLFLVFVAEAPFAFCESNTGGQAG